MISIAGQNGSSAARMAGALASLRKSSLLENRGRVVQVTGLVIESEGPIAAVGDICHIQSPRRDQITLAEVVGFRNHHLLLMPLGEVHGLQPGSEVTALGKPMEVPVGEGLKGRVIDALGQPLDDAGPLRVEYSAGINALPPHPLKRQRIKQVFQTGIKAIDTFIPCGRGQRMGIFAGSGVGKSTLLGMMASHAEADVNVIGLIGERGREVREFLEKDLDANGRRKSIVVVATSNQPALARLKGAFLAMSIAEYFRDAGQNVLLMMDSVTRFAMAQREIGLAIGEPPTTRGYTPSVFSLLPQLLERAGTAERGSITGLFTVLIEADDMDDPIGDSVRSILDGHIWLTRELAMQNQYPAVDVLASVSRLDRDLLNPTQLELVGRARDSMATFRKNQDLINIGAYHVGSNPAIDQAIHYNERLRTFLRQPVKQASPTTESWQLLEQTMLRTEAPKAAGAPARSGPQPAAGAPSAPRKP